VKNSAARRIFLFLSTISSLSMASPPSAETLLKAAEYIRNPQQDYQMTVLLKDRKAAQSDSRKYSCLIKGRDRAIIKFLEPAVDRGTKVLMVENQMYVSTPAAAKPVRISPRQRIAGNAAYGDVVRLNFIDNYSAKLLRSEKHEGREAYVLELNAKDDRPVTYDRVVYWVDKANQRPLKALYQTASGKTIREATFGGYRRVLGAERPTEFVLTDHLERNHVTTLKFEGTRAASLPDLLFDKQNFARDVTP